MIVTGVRFCLLAATLLLAACASQPGQNDPESANKYLGARIADPVRVFAAIRDWKNKF